uniref:Uncharacterized protein n=1 Tax=Glossina austeni TaxID=7395 RepID=A0A1A9VWY7_GLOAU
MSTFKAELVDIGNGGCRGHFFNLSLVCCIGLLMMMTTTTTTTATATATTTTTTTTTMTTDDDDDDSLNEWQIELKRAPEEIKTYKHINTFIDTYGNNPNIRDSIIT